MPNVQTMLQWMIDKCNDEHVGYSQTYRQQQTVNGITYYDCSSMMWYALKVAGFDIVSANNGSSYPFTTSTMGVVLDRLGFKRLSATSVDWLPADIVWRSGHTEMVMIPNITMGAHTDGVALEDQVSINKYHSDKSSWTYVYRYTDWDNIEPEPEPTPVTRRKMPLWMMCRGY